jgi:hypothetical protein
VVVLLDLGLLLASHRLGAHHQQDGTATSGAA